MEFRGVCLVCMPFLWLGRRYSGICIVADCRSWNGMVHRDMLLERRQERAIRTGRPFVLSLYFVSSKRSPCTVNGCLSDTAQIIMVGIDWPEVGSAPSSTLSGKSQGMACSHINVVHVSLYPTQPSPQSNFLLELNSYSVSLFYFKAGNITKVSIEVLIRFA